MSKRIFFLSLAVLAAAHSGFAQSYLFYLEAQGVAGFSWLEDKAVFYSMDQREAMQKPSLGFDYILRFSGEGGDFGTFAVQARLAVNAEGGDTFEPQLYNAYFKYKAGFADLWAGHNRISLGISSYFDTHSHLLQTLAMEGFGFDRDWGLGLSRDLPWGNIGFSLTTGSGMPLYFKGNYLLSARVSKGILLQDNYAIGLSAGYGDVLETMGYELLSPDPLPFRMIGVDLAYLWNNIDNRLEVMAGKNRGEDSVAFYWRLGVSLFDEERLKLEAQPSVWKIGEEKGYRLAGGITYIASGDITLRAIYQYDGEMKGSSLIFQFYYYRRISF